MYLMSQTISVYKPTKEVLDLMYHVVEEIKFESMSFIFINFR